MGSLVSSGGAGGAKADADAGATAPSNRATAPSRAAVRRATEKRLLTADDVRWVYEHLMIPNFPVQDELDPLEAWLETAAEAPDAWTREAHGRRFFALVPEDGKQRFAALAVVETFASDAARGREQTALLAYIVTHPDYRRAGLSRRLVESCRAEHPVLFLETETVPAAPGPERDARIARIGVHRRNGFAVVDKFHYVQPPCSPDQGPCDDLTLMVYRIRPDQKQVSSRQVRSFADAMCAAYDALGAEYCASMLKQADAVAAFDLA